MADLKISELASIPAVASADVLAIVDTSLSETNKVSVEDLLRGAPSGTAAAPSIAFVDDPDTGIFKSGTNELAISTGGTQRVVVDSSGQLGVGTASPGAKLDVSGADAIIHGATVGRGAGSISTNTAVGTSALAANTIGTNNTAAGYQALSSNTEGVNNTANGRDTLRNNTTGGANTASGLNALLNNTTGSNNTATGLNTLYNNTTGANNTASGVSALFSNTTGDLNTANGREALFSNNAGSNGTAIGYQSQYYANDTATPFTNTNVSVGYRSLYGSATAANNTGLDNTAVGYEALRNNTAGSLNTANGRGALRNNTTGNNNTADGREALRDNTTGSGNFGAAFLNSAGTYAPVFNPTVENNRVVMGHTSVTNAYVQVAWTVVSDARDKMNFAPVPHGLDFINQLQPTAYQFKVDRDTEEPNGPVRYGFKAQDILALEGDNPVIIDNEDEDRLKYKGEHLVPVLVKAVQELSAENAALKARLDAAGI